MKKSKRRVFTTAFISIVIAAALSVGTIRCTEEKPIGNTSALTPAILKKNFLSVPDSDKLWVYYWWLKGNVTKESITHDLEEMKKKGIGGFLLFDSRRYHDGYFDGNIPVPLHIRMEFMSPEWREMVKYTMGESARLGLKMSMNLANTGGSLRGPWDLGQDGPKKLIWTSATVHGPVKISQLLTTPGETRYYQDVDLIAVKVKSGDLLSGNNPQFDLNVKWNNVVEPAKDAAVAEKCIALKDKFIDGILQWDVPEGEWKILRFGFTVIADTGSVDILNREAVTRFFNLMGTAILNDAGPLAGETLKYFYNVSWEGGEPNWTKGFGKEFFKFRGYEIKDYLPVLAGMITENHSLSMRFLRDYYRTISDCFLENCYKTIGQLCKERDIKWHSENGGPWSLSAAMFKEADMLKFWGSGDFPQGEFWVGNQKDIEGRSNARYASMAAHIYGHNISAIEAFTHMTTHYSKYPANLKTFADANFIDGSNMFIWHTFTASPPELGKPGYEYFAGTHLNPRVTWWDMSEGFINYLSRCQHMLRQGNFVADVCCYVSDRNYVSWGRGEKWNEKSSLRLNPGYSYDLINTDVLVNRLSVKNGRIVLAGGMNYRLMVVDLVDQTIPVEALKKIIELAKSGAAIVLGQIKPDRTSGLKDFPLCDQEIVKMADKLWGEDTGKSNLHRLGKGLLIKGKSMEDVLKDKKILPDFEGPFEYIHRSSDEVDIYFLRGAGKADCTFRVGNKKPEIWDPVSASVTSAESYRFTGDGRTNVTISLPENGSVFVVFSGTKEKNYVTSVTGPVEGFEIKDRVKDTLKYVYWKSGNYSFIDARKNSREIYVETMVPFELKGPWDVTFTPGRGAPLQTTFNKLTLWNDNSDKGIKYFSGTATYKTVFNLTGQQVKDPVRLQLGEVFIIARVWVNGIDLGVVWTDPWNIEISGAIKPGKNELEIEVANCWVNRLIGDAALPENKRFTRTNIRLLPDDRYLPEYPVDKTLQGGKYSRWMYISARDSLLPSGLIGPVYIEFGKERGIIF
jgi:hypothetical protein